MHEIDCLGDMCPSPIMKLKQCREIKEHGGQIKLVSTVGSGTTVTVYLPLA